ncbi:MAG: hypothetical protein ACUVXA_14970, partial [Candidatus Jordarchaeum sp.]
MGLREEFLALLKKDEEFKYTVLGYLGLNEILRRMDSYQSIQTKTLEEIKKLREGQGKIWEEIKGIKEDIRGINEEIKGIKEDIRGINEEIK